MSTQDTQTFGSFASPIMQAELRDFSDPQVINKIPNMSQDGESTLSEDIYETSSQDVFLGTDLDQDLVLFYRNNIKRTAGAALSLGIISFFLDFIGIVGVASLVFSVQIYAMFFSKTPEKRRAVGLEAPSLAIAGIAALPGMLGLLRIVALIMILWNS